MQEARKAMGVKTKHLAINKTNQRKSQYEDEQKYLTTSVNINCPRTMRIRKYFPGEQRYPRSSSQDKSYGKRLEIKHHILIKLLVVPTIQTNRQCHGQNNMEQMVSQIIYRNAYQRKTIPSKLTHKQQPKDNQNEIWNLFEPTCHIGIR